MRRLLAGALLLSFAFEADAQEQEDFTVAFARVKGGAIYDEKIGVDGTLVSEKYLLTHIVCTDGSKKLRVMLPHGPQDDETFFKLDGAPSSLRKKGGDFTVDFKIKGKTLTKTVKLKPVNDPKSQHSQQFEISLNVGDALWTAMRSPEPGNVMMMIGTGGTPVSLPRDATFTKFLRSCGIKSIDAP